MVWIILGYILYRIVRRRRSTRERRKIEEQMKFYESTDRAIQVYRRRSLEARTRSTHKLVDLIDRGALTGGGLPFPAEFTEEDVQQMTHGKEAIPTD